jgi:hypothetical protein
MRIQEALRYTRMQAGLMSWEEACMGDYSKHIRACIPEARWLGASKCEPCCS